MKPYTNSSALSERVEVERESGDVDAWGNKVYKTFFVAFAKVADRAGGETLINSQNKRVSTAKTTFTFRATAHSAAIVPTMLIKWRGFVHEILTPIIFTDDRNFINVEAVRRY